MQVTFIIQVAVTANIEDAHRDEASTAIDSAVGMAVNEAFSGDSASVIDGVTVLESSTMSIVDLPTNYQY